MALQKQSLEINFAQGLDTKLDPWQIPPGKFLALQNSVFDKIGQLKKRNGFAKKANLPDTSSVFATTFNGNLTAIGNSLNAFIEGSNSWVNKGTIRPVELSTLPLIRNNSNQIQTDSVTDSNGFTCVVYTQTGSSTTRNYAIIDSVTGQYVVNPTVIPGVGVTGSPRVFLLGSYFVIVFTNVIAAVNHLQYIAINRLMPSLVVSNTDISTTYTPTSTVSFDGVVSNGTLYIAYNGSDVGGAIRINKLDSTLLLSAPQVFATFSATMISVTADDTQNTPVIYVSFYDGTNGWTFAVNQVLATVFAPQQIITAETVLNITSSAQNMVCEVFYEVENAYSYDAGLFTNYIKKIDIDSTGSVGTASVVIRSLGLASKSFIVDGVLYFVGVYSTDFQPTYFIVDEDSNIIAKLAYSNGGQYYTLGLPYVTVSGSSAMFSYFFKDLTAGINRDQGATVTTGVYSQTGINQVTINITTNNILSSEIGGSLQLTGGFLWQYDGVMPVESNFFVWPDAVEATTSTTGGSLADQQYYYQVTYEWTDNSGNIQRSSPSLPIGVLTTGGGTSSNTINIPTLRLTYKTQVRIVIYRWSTAQQTYYQITSITSPLYNNPAVDSVQFVDTQADSSILGNNILYTTGGVIENIAPPATNSVFLAKSRLFLIDAEDPNLLWYSKQVIENTPVEMSDLFTIYVAPTSGAQGSTGPTKCGAAMDDKVILFKKDAIYYFNGTGPDNTGANNDFSEPTFITSTVGCSNQKSIVFIPQGLMFQSDKGIWLLGRDLSTKYIGAPVEQYNQYIVLSAINIPGTNQVRFTLSNGVTLMYDYYVDQWGTFNNIPAISSTLYQDLHTYINSLGEVFQENPGSYLDGSNPVLMSFTTGWFSFAGIQGFQRAYWFLLLGQYYSPHKLQVVLAYNYDPAIYQTLYVSPINFSPNWGGDATWGSSSPWGGPSAIEQNRIFFNIQKCESFQVSITEAYDSTFGVIPGAGLTLTGLNLIYGAKRGFTTTNANQNVG